jgi:hypothetical protein
MAASPFLRRLPGRVMGSSVVEPMIRRGLGRQSSRPRAFATSVVVALAAGVLTYRFLRGGEPGPA